METMNLRHFHLIRRHSYGKGQYTIGSELSPLTLLSTDKPMKVFINGEVYSLPPTKYKPAKNGKFMVQRPKCKTEINIIKRYNALHPDFAPLSTDTGPIRKVINEDTPMYHAIHRTEPLERFNRVESAYRIHEHIEQYIPTHTSELYKEETSYGSHVKGVYVTDECGTQYYVSLNRFGYYIVRAVKVGEKKCRVINFNTRLFRSMTYEGVLSWFLGLYYERTQHVSRRGVTPDFEWYVNSERGGGKIQKILDLDDGHLYNIARWVCTKLVQAESQYVQMYTVDLIETVNELLVNRIHQEEINRCCLGQI
jgi:hypothetical protein